MAEPANDLAETAVDAVDGRSAESTNNVLPEALDAFISYRRAESDQVAPIAAAIEATGRDIWLDTVDIPAGTLWRTELTRAIEVSAAVVCFVSPSWLESAECRRELEYAVGLHKRLLPVQLSDVAGHEIVDALRDIQWIDARDRAPQQVAAQIIAAIDVDAEWVRDHTYWLGRAIRWNEDGRDRSLLVRGKDLRAAEEWLDRPERDPRPNELQQDFVRASRRGERRRLQTLLTVASVVTVISIALATFAWYQRSIAIEQRNTANSRALAASAIEELDADPELSVALSQAAWQTLPTGQALTALRRSLTQSRVRRTIVSGSSSISHVRLTEDGSTVISVSPDGRLRAWDLATGLQRGEMSVSDQYSWLSSDADGTRGLSWDQTGHAVLWSFDPRGNQFTQESTYDGVTAGAVSADGHLVVLGRMDGGVLTIVDGVVTQSQVAGDEFPVTIAVSDNGQAVAVGTQLRSYDETTLPPPGSVGGRLVIANSTAGVPLREYTFPVAEVALSADGATVFSFGQDGTGAVQRIDGSGQPTTVTGAFEATIDPTGRYAAVSNKDGKLQLIAIGGETRTLSSADEPYSGLVFGGDGNSLVGVGLNAVARVWNTGDGSVRAVLPQSAGVMNGAAWNGDARLVTAHQDGTIRVWELPPAPMPMAAGDRTGRNPNGVISGLSALPSGAAVVTASGDGLVQAWRPDTGESVCLAGRLRSGVCAETFATINLLGVNAAGSKVAVDPSGSRLAVQGADGGVVVLDLAAGATEVSHTEADGTRASAGTIGYSPDGSVLVSQRGDESPRLIDPATGQVTGTLVVPPGTKAFGINLAFLPGRGGIVAATSDGKVVLFGLDGRMVRNIGSIDGQPLAIAIAPDATTIALGVDKQIRLLDVADGHLIGTLAGHQGLVDALTYSADGFLVSGSVDPTVRVWDTTAKEQFVSYQLPVGSAQSVLVVPGTTTIATAGIAHSAYLLSCDVCSGGDELADLASGRVTRPITDRERERFGLPAGTLGR